MRVGVSWGGGVICAAVMMLTVMPSSIFADAATTGDVLPATDPLTWANSTQVYVGETGVGSLTVDGGSAIDSDQSYIGYNPGSTGEATIDGTDPAGLLASMWTNTRNLYVGYDGAGTLNITNGGAVSNLWGFLGADYGSVGVATVDGAGSTWTNSSDLHVGNLADGTLNITGGGAVGNVEGHIGRYSGSTGDITLDGIGSRWTNTGALYVGSDGAGTLSVAHGGVLSNTTGNVGNVAGSTGVVTVDGIGSTWTNTETLNVGNAGSGTLNIRNGGAVSSVEGHIGTHAGSTGNVAVDGTGSAWTSSGALVVGHAGRGTLNVTHGGTVSNTFGDIGSGAGSTGDVVVDGSGSVWASSNDLTVGGYGAGTLSITNGGVVTNGEGSIGSGSGSTGVVTVDGLGSTWTTNTYMLSVGVYGSGTLNITNGALVKVNGALAIDYDTVFSSTPVVDSCINMSAGGMLALLGDADDSLDQFLGLIEGTDAINYWDTGLGDWDAITNATLGLDYTLALGLNDLAGYTVLTVGTYPEPSTIPAPSSLLLASVGLALVRRLRHRKD